MPSSPFDLVIFDCDGVLVDSELISLRTLLATLLSYGAEVDLDYVRAKFLGRSFSSVTEDFRRLTGGPAPDGFEADYLDRLFAAYRSDLQAMAGALELIAGLSGSYCVATSSKLERARLSLELTGLLPFFRDRIFCASMVPRGKPAPDLFLHAAERCGAEPARCLVIEDSEAGVLAGLDAGMTVWRFVGGSHFNAGDPALTEGSVRRFQNMRDVAAALAIAQGGATI